MSTVLRAFAEMTAQCTACHCCRARCAAIARIILLLGLDAKTKKVSGQQSLPIR